MARPKKLNHLTTVAERIEEAKRIIKSIKPEDAISPKQVCLSVSNQLIKNLEEILDLRKPALKLKSICGYSTHFQEFARWYRANGSPAMNALKSLHFLNYISDKKRSPTTRKAYRCTLKPLFGDLKNLYKNRYTDNPFAEVRKLAEARKTKDWFRPSHVTEVAALLKIADPSLWLAFKIMFHCFTRPNELRQLKVADYNFETKKFRVDSSIAKTSRTRFVNIPVELLPDLEILKQFPANYYLFTINDTAGEMLIGRDTLSKRHEKFMRSLNYPKGFTFYSWENTGAVKMLMMDKKPMRYISKCMGHHSLDMSSFCIV